MADRVDTTGLTLLQARALRFVAAQLQEKGLSPTVNEVAQAMGVRSRSAAHRALVALRERGKITWRERLQRSIVLVPERRAGHVLSPDLQAKLEQFCAAHGERIGSVVEDAVTLHLDALIATAEAHGGAL